MTLRQERAEGRGLERGTDLDVIHLPEPLARAVRPVGRDGSVAVGPAGRPAARWPGHETVWSGGAGVA